MGSITEIISFSSVHTEIPLTFEECDGKRTKQLNADESCDHRNKQVIAFFSIYTVAYMNT